MTTWLIMITQTTDAPEKEGESGEKTWGIENDWPANATEGEILQNLKQFINVNWETF